MKKLMLFPVAAMVLAMSGCNKEAEATKPAASAAPETVEQKQAYSVGTRMAQSHKQIVDDIIEVQGSFDIDMYLLGIRDTLTGEFKLAEEEMNTISEEYRKSYLENKKALDAKKQEEAKKASADYLEANKAKEGIATTESGLQYKVLKQGEGKKPVKGDKVEVLYTGKLIDGTVFDTTSEDNKPRQFDITRVVKGWTEGLQLMAEGSKFEFHIPPELGYGARDMSQIPGNSVLVFEVELIKVHSPEAPKEEAQKEAPKK